MANVTQEESLVPEIVKVVYYSASRKKLNISGIGSTQIAEMIVFLDNFYKNLAKPNYVLAGLYLPLIAIATVANILVIVVVCKNQYMRSSTNYFVINLCVADLFVTAVCMPTAISQAISMNTSQNEIMCKIVSYSQGIAVAASVFTIMVMSIDRYMAIKDPIAFRTSFNRKRMCGIITAIWLFSLGIFGPMLQAAKLTRVGLEKYNLTVAGIEERYIYYPPPFSVCHENLTTFGPHGHYFGVVWFALIYVIPVCIILIVYLMMARTLYAKKPPFDPDIIEGSVSHQQGCRIVRERKKIAHVLLTLAVLFALCWFPYNVLRVLLDLRVITDSQLKGDVLPYCLVFGHGNSMLNPLVYCCMTRTFRRNISELMHQAWRGITKCGSLRNALPVAASACSSRSSAQINTTSNLASLSKGGIYCGSVQTQLIRARNFAAISLCDDSESKKHRSYWKCYRYADLPMFRANPCDSYHLVAPNNFRFSMINIASPTDQHCKDDLRVERIRTKSLDELTMPMRRSISCPSAKEDSMTVSNLHSINDS